MYHFLLTFLSGCVKILEKIRSVNMAKIKKCSLENADKFYIDKAQWGYDEYMPEVYLKMAYNEKEFLFEFTVFEKEPTRTKTKHYEGVHEDSCAEVFLNFSPKTEKRYINFEVNANGVMNPSYRLDRHDSEHLTLEEIDSFDINAEVKEDCWTVSYKVGFDILKKYYPDFDIATCDYIIGNAYKCGDKTPVAHYLALFDVGCEKPDFHRPEYFGKIEIEK